MLPKHLPFILLILASLLTVTSTGCKKITNSLRARQYLEEGLWVHQRVTKSHPTEIQGVKTQDMPQEPLYLFVYQDNILVHNAGLFIKLNKEQQSALMKEMRPFPPGLSVINNLMTGVPVIDRGVIPAQHRPQGGYLIRPLYEALLEQIQLRKKYLHAQGDSFTGKVILSIEPQIPMETVLQIIYTTAQAELSDFSFAFKTPQGSTLLSIYLPKIGATSQKTCAQVSVHLEESYTQLKTQQASLSSGVMSVSLGKPKTPEKTTPLDPHNPPLDTLCAQHPRTTRLQAELTVRLKQLKTQQSTCEVALLSTQKKTPWHRVASTMATFHQQEIQMLFSVGDVERKPCKAEIWPPFDKTPSDTTRNKVVPNDQE